MKKYENRGEFINFAEICNVHHSLKGGKDALGLRIICEPNKCGWF